jgi:hypothetical protein
MYSLVSACSGVSGSISPDTPHNVKRKSLTSRIFSSQAMGIAADGPIHSEMAGTGNTLHVFARIFMRL